MIWGMLFRMAFTNEEMICGIAPTMVVMMVGQVLDQGDEQVHAGVYDLGDAMPRIAVTSPSMICGNRRHNGRDDLRQRGNQGGQQLYPGVDDLGDGPNDKLHKRRDDGGQSNQDRDGV